MVYIENAWDLEVDFSVLKGKIFTKIELSPEKDSIFFHTTEGEIYQMAHYDDCCESVDIEDINGDLENLIGHKIQLAEEVSNSDTHPKDVNLSKIGYSEEYQPESFTWTFYKLATVKGHVTIRWFGTSNGYYSESVQLYKIK